MTRIRFYVGTKGNGGIVQHHLARQYLIATFGGYSLTHLEGAWQSAHDAPVVREQSICYEILTDKTQPPPQHVAEVLRDYCDQLAVLYTVETVQGELVRHPATAALYYLRELIELG